MKRLMILLLALLPALVLGKSPLWSPKVLPPATTFLCVVEHSTGFTMKNDKWQQQVFTPGLKFIVLNDGPARGYDFEFWQLQHLEFGFGPACERVGSLLTCLSGSESMIMSMASLRFVYSATGDYVTSISGAETPFIALGSCTKLSANSDSDK